MVRRDIIKYILIFLPLFIFSQNHTTLEPNLNAKDITWNIKENLLFLQSNDKIFQINILQGNETIYKSENNYINLEEFEVGNYLILLYQDERIVAIRMNRLLKINKPKIDIIVDTPIIKTPYNISSPDRNGIQSREEYRKNNLRPNGKKYE